MNFLSHYYLHHDSKDNYFTVGLTMPDLLGFHSRKIRITKKVLKKIGETEKDYNMKSLIAGMSVHLDIDKWFHNSDFFKEKVFFLHNSYTKFNNSKNKFPHFYSLILVEILIDRYLLNIEPDIADNFYASYKKFDFQEASRLFAGLKHFDNHKFISLANNVANSTFLKEYVDDYSIISILARVSKRIGLPMNLNIDNNKFADFIRISYNQLAGSIKDFIDDAKRDANILFP